MRHSENREGTLMTKVRERFVRGARKLRERAGLSTTVEVLIFVLIAVVIGGILIVLFGDTVKTTWETISTRIADLFNYK